VAQTSLQRLKCFPLSHFKGFREVFYERCITGTEWSFKIASDIKLTVNSREAGIFAEEAVELNDMGQQN